jgi:hypothetical protein
MIDFCKGIADTSDEMLFNGVVTLTVNEIIARAGNKEISLTARR